jgi:HK97 gp10 family phage protein
MASPDDDLQKYLGDLPVKLKRELVAAIKEQADGLADAIRAEAPVKTGALRDSVKVRRKRGDLDLEVTAGGDTTTKEIRAGSAENYDYALAAEYGTVNEPAQPFFYNTARERMPDIQEAIQQAVEDVLAKA